MIALYARVSTEEQVKHGFSLKEQLFECRKIVCSNALIKEYVDEGITGEVLERPALMQLRADVRDGLVSKVICLDPDRLSRKLSNQLIITEEIEKKSELIFVNHDYKNTPEGMLFYQMRGAISEFEKAKINERMSRGRRQKARNGLVVRDYEVYGYNYNRDTCKMEVNTYEAEIVKIIFRLFAGRDMKNNVQGINGIARFLTDKGVATKRNVGIWHRQVVRQVLLNRAYIGEFYQNRWNTEGMMVNKFKSPEERITMKERPKDQWILVPCPAIIEKDEFEYAQKLLNESRRRWAGISKNQYLLSGLIRCGICNNTMTGVNYSNWGKKYFVYTDVKSTIGAKNRGCSRKIKTDEIDDKVWNLVLDWMRKQEIDEDDQDEANNNDAFFEELELSRVQKRMRDIEKNRQNLIDFLAVSTDELGNNSINEIRQKLINLKNEEEALNNKRNELILAVGRLKGKVHKGNLLNDATEYYLSAATEEITFDDKKALIRLLVREIIAYENEIKVYGF